MVEEILNTRLMVKKAMKKHKNDKVLNHVYISRFTNDQASRNGHLDRNFTYMYEHDEHFQYIPQFQNTYKICVKMI